MGQKKSVEILVQGGATNAAYDLEHLARVFFPGAAVRKGQSSRGELVWARMNGRMMAAGVRLGGKCFVRRVSLAGAGLHGEASAVVPQTETITSAPVPPSSRSGPPVGSANAKEAWEKALSRLLYDLLREATGVRPPWGMLTGVRPLSLYRKLAHGGEGAARQRLEDYYDVPAPNLRLLAELYQRQQLILQRGNPRSYSLYISIPFCPSRCDYCSFVSRTIEREEALVEPYLAALAEELRLTAEVAKGGGLRLESIYIGGGTPTALSARQLARLLAAVEEHFNATGAPEYTVEAGRPDCTDLEKLRILKEYGVGRISINPQTMQDEVLRTIGRRHTAADVLRCFEEARRAGHGSVNMDLIAGLPGDTPGGFAETLAQVLALNPENITLHTLTMKRASNLVIDGRRLFSPAAGMLDAAYPKLRAAGYAPYYLYRQKATVENLENTGWALPGTEGLYNVYIMEEAHTILACGAGAATKLVAGGGAIIERRYNPKFAAEYLGSHIQVLSKKRGVSEFYASHLDP